MPFQSELCHDSLYNLPSNLSQVYISCLRKLNLYEKALSADDSVRHSAGGASQDESYEHFFGKFGNSCSRLIFLLCNFDGRFGDINARFASVFSEGTVSFIDTPAGTGAGGLTIISSICHMRTVGKLPSLPLTIDLHAADISIDALNVYGSMLDDLRPIFQEQSLTVNLTKHKWDVLDINETGLLLRRISQNILLSNDVLFVVANFSDFAKDHHEQVVEHVETSVKLTAGMPATFVWVEPQKKINKTLHKVNKIFDRLRYIAFGYESEDGTGGNYNWLCPIKGGQVSSNMKLVVYRKYDAVVRQFTGQES